MEEAEGRIPSMDKAESELQNSFLGLIWAFLEEGDLSFASFKGVWSSRHFSLIHHHIAYGLDPVRRLQFLFGLLLNLLPLERHKVGNLLPKPASIRGGVEIGSGTLPFRIAVIYMLYVLHKTQLFTPKERIRVDAPSMACLLLLMKTLRSKGDHSIVPLFLLWFVLFCIIFNDPFFTPLPLLLRFCIIFSDLFLYPVPLLLFSFFIILMIALLSGSGDVGLDCLAVLSDLITSDM
ncbi:unnamed protein product, partial [Chrysoparadoxa australica]